jgi:hypothetical protein
MVFDAGGPLIFNCRYTSILIVVDHNMDFDKSTIVITCISQVNYVVVRGWLSRRSFVRVSFVLLCLEGGAGLISNFHVSEFCSKLITFADVTN